MLPNYICPGAQKAGTTSLFRLLSQHPSVFIPEGKETKFFCDDDKWNLGIDWYRSLFAGAGDEHSIVGDMTPEYMYVEGVAERISQVLGDGVRFIFMLRSPVDRAYSHYWMSVRRGFESQSFAQAIRLEKSRVARGQFSRDHFSYLGRGYYARQIRAFLPFFPKEQMKFILFEEFASGQDETMAGIFSFLDLELDIDLVLGERSNPARMPRSNWLMDIIKAPPSKLKTVVRLILRNPNARGRLKKWAREANYAPFNKPPMPAGLRASLVSAFEADMTDLECLIGRDLSSWRETRQVHHELLGDGD